MIIVKRVRELDLFDEISLSHSLSLSLFIKFKYLHHPKKNVFSF